MSVLRSTDTYALTVKLLEPEAEEDLIFWQVVISDKFNRVTFFYVCSLG